MKKILMSMLCIVMVCALAACSTAAQPESSAAESAEPSASESTAPSDGAGTAPAATESAGADDTASAGSGKTLVVYYSASGNTEQAANYIAEATGADLFALEPVEPYTEDDLNWTEEGSRVNAEHEDESLRDIELVADTVDNWEEYDTVFIGYPIWWGIAAWPVDGFVEANDFTGKTVIPFCTSASSGLGESGTLLEEMAGTGEWLEGRRFSSGVSEDEVRAWVEELGLLA